MDKDVSLLRLFDGVAMTVGGTSGASMFLSQGAIYKACKWCAYIGVPQGDESKLAENKVSRYSNELPKMPITDINNLKPEIQFDRDMVPVNKDTFPELTSQAHAYYIIPMKKPPFGEPGFWVLRKQRKEDNILQYVRTLPYGPNNFHFLELRACVYCLSSWWLDITETATGTDVLSAYSQLDAVIMRTKLGGKLVMVLTGESSLCYHLLELATDVLKLGDVIIPETGDVYIGDGWQEKTWSFKTFKKKVNKKGTSKMPKSELSALPERYSTGSVKPRLGNPLSALRESAKAAYAAVDGEEAVPAETLVEKAPHADPEIDHAIKSKAAIPSAVKAAVLTPAAPKTSVADSQPKVEESSEVEDTVVEHVKEEKQPAEVQKPKRARTRKTTTMQSYNYEPLLQYLSAAKEPLTVAEFDKALTEIRALRDVISAASRKIVNLVTGMHAVSKDAVDKVTALQGILK